MSKRIKILFVIPDMRGIVEHKYYPPHIGVASIASMLLESGFDVKVHDIGKTKRLKLYLESLKTFSPDFVGFTAYTCNIELAAYYSEICKTYNKNAITIIGGAHATALPITTLEQYKSFDYLIAGEGETATKELIEQIISKNNCFNIEGLAFRQKSQVIFSENKTHFEDLNKLPIPAWQLFGLQKVNENTLRVETSRGCPYNCKFCSHMLGKAVRYKSVQNVIDEIKHLVENYRITEILFSSETFTLNKKYITELCHAIIENKINEKIRWRCNTRVDCLDYEIISNMKNAGCYQIIIGLESGDQHILNSIGKGFKLEQVIKTTQIINKLKIPIHANFIIGTPEDTVKTILKTIKLARSLKLELATFSIFTPYPGTFFTETLRNNNNYTLQEGNWSKYDTQKSTVLIKHKNLSHFQIWFFHKLAYFLFYMRPYYFFRVFRFISLKIFLQTVVSTLKDIFIFLFRFNH